MSEANAEFRMVSMFAGFIVLIAMFLSIKKGPFARISRALLGGTFTGAVAVGVLGAVVQAYNRPKILVNDPLGDSIMAFYIMLPYFAILSAVALPIWLLIRRFGQDRLTYAIIFGGLGAGVFSFFFWENERPIMIGVVAVSGAVAGFVAWKIAHLPTPSQGST